ncbi:MAG: DUF2628 domain-containing protein [Bacteroidales bacterium]|nr:DUF2628 domain-containing protein [Bacteroidales bacterium]
MNRYIGKKCPYCKTEIKSGEEIVVCSVCEMPHHKECWYENGSCTTFGCTGTILKMGKVVGVPGVVFCGECGTKNATGSLFCSECGTKLKQAESQELSYRPPQQTVSNNYRPAPAPAQTPVQAPARAPMPAYNSGGAYGGQGYQTYGNTYTNMNANNGQFNGGNRVDPVVFELIGTKREYYVPKFQKIKMTNQNAGWNWAAFLVTPFWLIYRKMYAYGAAALGAGLLCVMTGLPLLYLVLYGGYIAIGIFGNSIYLNFLEKLAQQVKTTPEPYRTQLVAKNAGTSGGAVAIGAAIYFVVAMLVMVI